MQHARIECVAESTYWGMPGVRGRGNSDICFIHWTTMVASFLPEATSFPISWWAGDGVEAKLQGFF